MESGESIPRNERVSCPRYFFKTEVKRNRKLNLIFARLILELSAQVHQLSVFLRLDTLHRSIGDSFFVSLDASVHCSSALGSTRKVIYEETVNPRVSSLTEELRALTRTILNLVHMFPPKFPSGGPITLNDITDRAHCTSSRERRET